MRTLLEMLAYLLNGQTFKIRFTLFTFFLPLMIAVNAQSLTPVFEKGNAAYNAGNYEKAVEFYEAVLDSGTHSAALYFNLGNSYYRLNQVAESIYYYEKAKQLDAKDPDIEFNSSFANNMTIDAIEPLPQSQFAAFNTTVFNRMSVDGWGIAIVLLAWLVFIFFLCYLFYNNPIIKRSFFTAFFVSLLLMMGSFFFTFFSHQEAVNTEYAIIFSKQINIWTEPNERADVQFVLHEGTKVTLLDTLDEWQKIRIANGSEGWTKNAVLRSLK